MGELKECPYCGKTPVGSGALGEKVWCTNKECKNFEIRMDREAWQIRPIESDLNYRLNMLREELHITKDSLKDETVKSTLLEGKIETIVENLATSTALFASMKNKQDILQKSLDEYKEKEEERFSALYKKMQDEQEVYRYKLESLQSRLDIADEALSDIISSGKKLETIRVEEYDIANKALKRIRTEY